MEFSPILGNTVITLTIILTFLVAESVQQSKSRIKEFSLGDEKLCSPTTKRKVKFESLVVTQGRTNEHSLDWRMPDICKFEFQSYYYKGGVVAVIQKLDLRKNDSSGECIDYIQFHSRRGLKSDKYCGVIDAKIIMDNSNLKDQVPLFYPMSYNNAFVDIDGELDVVIYIAKQHLQPNEKTEIEIVFTSYLNCKLAFQSKWGTFVPCYSYNQSIIKGLDMCLNSEYFEDGYINCPHFGCPDEGGCLFINTREKESKVSVGSRVIIGSISTLAVLFGVFILVIWAFKKHKLFCWAQEFAHPTLGSQHLNVSFYL